MAIDPTKVGANQRALIKQHQDWLKAVLAQTKLKPTALAVKAGLAPSTLTKPLKDNQWSNALSAGTIAKISSVTGLPGPGDPGPEFREPDAVEYAPEGTTPTDRAIRALIDGRNHVHPWTITGRSVDRAGLRPGDIALVDLQAEPEPGDVVVAQVYSRHGAETVFRVFDGRYLTSHSSRDEPPRVLLADGDTVLIMGVVTERLSRRAAAA